MHHLKRLLMFLAASGLIFVVLNWPYFHTQINYLLFAPTVQELDPNEPDPELPKLSPNTISIDSLDISAPIVYIEETSEDGFQQALQKGVVHYPGTALPGRPGNAYFFGHSSDLITAPGDYKTVFALLPRIEIGSTVDITDQNGRLYQYRIVKFKVVQPNDLSVLEQDESVSQISLQTSYPVGTALRRFIAIGELIN